MIHYRPLGPIAAISFDLDDTLYDNGPLIRSAEAKLQQWLAERVKTLADSGPYFWQWRQRVISEDPMLAHDATASRHQALSRGLTALGVNQAQGLADAAMAHFLEWRSDCTLGPEIHLLLEQLSSRRPLVAISNGNADIERLGLGKYFKGAFHAGASRRMKPAPDLFLAAAQHLKLTPKAILHIGDHLRDDIQGALQAGYQAAWYNPEGLSIKSQGKGLLLPHFEFQSLASLRQLL
ncbi:HAD-IA family hydrolase [Gallaecimonas xiamenensis]|uniref:Hydrolase n=1 Tax=Gallaecimonas xiamenensis 3-C-1 TaxID=745411 RepID=K2IZD4_9GAMM|nr:HAD-IA family hydrolase [Gallaecimonas xiamenensis]EKE75891.1 hydrolase [Gallaecimonas xiamenensis 3-C-1]